MITRQLLRKFTTSAIRRSEIGDGVPGYNVPFPTQNKWAVVTTFCLFFGSGFSLPFITLRYMMLK